MMLPVLLLSFFSAHAVEPTLTVQSVQPRQIGTRIRSRLRVEAKALGKAPEKARFIDDSFKLYQVDELGDTVGDPLCTLVDTGDSRTGDVKGGDGIYTCFAWVWPKFKANLGLIVQARRPGPKGTEVPMTSKIFLISVVDGALKTEIEEDNEQGRIMKQARQIWSANRARHGLTDAAVASTVREVREIEGVRDVKLTTGNDLIIYFKVGGRDQLPTYEPK